MEKKGYYNLFWFRGMLLGFFIPVIVLGFFFIGSNNPNNPLALLGTISVFPLAILQIPASIIGRGFGLPIETGEVAFIVCNFTTFGNILMIVLWTFIGAFIGWGVGIELSRNNKSDQKQASTASYPLICPKCGKGYDSSWEACLRCRTQLSKNKNFNPPQSKGDA